MSDTFDRVAGDQIPGGRDYQEDAFQLTQLHRSGEDALLLLLADGMGGHIGGARASELAVATFEARFNRSEGELLARLRDALEAANDAIAKDAASDPRFAEMGCTLVACLIDGNQLHWISVGDSPLWHLGAEGIARLNADHSMRPVLEDLVEMGRMSQEELDHDPRVNQLRSALIGEPLSMVDQNEEPFMLNEDDRIVIASDGLESLSAGRIGGICQEHEEPQQAVKALLESIEELDRPGQDNTTVIVYRHTSAGSVGERLQQKEASTVRNSAPTGAAKAEPESDSEPEDDVPSAAEAEAGTEPDSTQASGGLEQQPPTTQVTETTAQRKSFLQRLFGR